MKRKIFSKLLMGAFLIASVSMFVSCTDYDDDIKDLQKQIDANSKAISDLDALIKSGSVITNVTKTAEGVLVTLSNNQTFTVYNGEAGADATVWTIVDGYWAQDGKKTDYKAVPEDGKTPTITINSDGYWVINGTATETKAKGEDGSNGTTPTITINSDGYWVINGTVTTTKAKGEDGSNGTGSKGNDGDNGKYYQPNENGTFDVYVWDATKKTYVKSESESGKISYLASVPEGITAVLSSETLSLTGVKGATGTVVISLSGNLRGLVFITGVKNQNAKANTFFLDGIETIEYDWIQDSILVKVAQGATVINNHQNKGVQGTEDYIIPAPFVVADHIYEFGPSWGVDYHLNPANSDVKYDDIVGFNVLNPDVFYTRADATTPVITSPEKNAADATLFNVSDGIITAGLKVANPQVLAPTPTDEKKNADAYTVALQVKAKANNGETAIITSDYALLQPVKIDIDGLVWVKKPMYGEVDPAARVRTGDQKSARCTSGADATAWVHVYDNPADALADVNAVTGQANTKGAALELNYDETKGGLNLSDYLGIHYAKQKVGGTITGGELAEWTLGTWDFGDEKPYGLTYEFNLIDYSVDGNLTHDSRYADWGKTTDDATAKAAAKAKGLLYARNIREDGVTYADPSRTSVDREPLVQVLVKNAAGKVVIDGYILVHITQQAVDPQTPTNLTIATFPKGAAEFDGCNAEEALQTTWSQFNAYVLTDGFGTPIEKETFDAQYEPVFKTGSTTQLEVYVDAPEKGAGTAETPSLGTVTYKGETLGTTNHTWKWEFAEEELEALTHHQTAAVNVNRYIKFKAKTGSNATYPYVFIKLSADLTRADVKTEAFSEKNRNYWYTLTGSDVQHNPSLTSADLKAVVYDVFEPRDGKYISTSTIDGVIQNTLVGNAVKPIGTASTGSAANKFYLVPENRTITAQNGTVYTITPRKSPTDVAWNTLYCKYVTTPVADTHAYTLETLDEILNSCAIDFTKGAFNNVELYAVTNYATATAADYHQIATLNATTGTIQLLKNDYTKDVLNAVGYQANHANIQTELTAWLGLVANNGCDVAEKVTEGQFLTSWQRPINLKDATIEAAIDANTNGNFIYLIDYLKLFDWRGETVGYMWDDQTWFWSYYKVKSITVDVTPAKVKTNMHQTSASTFVALADVTTNAHLYQLDKVTAAAQTYNFNLDSYNSEAQNAALLTYMEANKATFGGFYYENNGDNVTEFDLQIPITIEYEWGKFQQTVTWHINRSAGN